MKRRTIHPNCKNLSVYLLVHHHLKLLWTLVGSTFFSTVSIRPKLCAQTISCFLFSKSDFLVVLFTLLRHTFWPQPQPCLHPKLHALAIRNVPARLIFSTRTIYLYCAHWTTFPSLVTRQMGTSLMSVQSPNSEHNIKADVRANGTYKISPLMSAVPPLLRKMNG